MTLNMSPVCQLYQEKQMKLSVTAIAMLMATLIFSIVYSTVGFQDVLDTPAEKSPLAPNTLYNSVVLAGKRLVSVGQRGHIVYSDDDGKSWVQATVPVSSDLVAVHFATPQKGWAVGHDGVVLQSADGGATWNKQFDGRTAAQSSSVTTRLIPQKGRMLRAY